MGVGWGGGGGGGGGGENELRVALEAALQSHWAEQWEFRKEAMPAL